MHVWITPARLNVPARLSTCTRILDTIPTQANMIWLVNSWLYVNMYIEPAVHRWITTAHSKQKMIALYMFVWMIIAIHNPAECTCQAICTNYMHRPTVGSTKCDDAKSTHRSNINCSDLPLETLPTVVHFQLERAFEYPCSSTLSS